MKTILSFSAALLFSAICVAQTISEDNLPSPVKDAFHAKFSIAEKVSWEMDYDKYDASFVVGKSEFAAIFDKDGAWLQTDTFLKPSELPKVVKDKLIKQFGELSAYKVVDAQKVETSKSIQYELEVEKGEITYEMIFSEDGQMIKQQEKKESDTK